MVDLYSPVRVAEVIERESSQIMRTIRSLVAGGAGFLGSHLIDRLLELGREVICVDNLYSGEIRNIEHLSSNPKFRFYEHDVSLPLDFTVDEIYNFACPASPVYYQASPVETIKASVLGSINLLELARNTDARILLASTSEVYGDPLEHPQNESYWGNVNPTGVRSCYDEGKRCAETLFFDYWRQYSVKIKVVRIFNTYGPRMKENDGRVISNFVVNALQGNKLSIYGDGEQTRSFCYVDDLIDGIIRMMSSSDSITGPINLGNPNEISIKELASRIVSLIGAEVPIQFSSLPQDDPRIRKPDISRAREYLAWNPKTSLEEGLVRTIDYYRGIMDELR